MGKLENLPISENLTFFKHSISDYLFMENLLVTRKFDYVFLLAAVASVADTIARPLETHEVNQEANVKIIEIIRKNNLKVKRLLFTSSAAVYGDNPELPKKEDSPIDPLTPYAIDKFATEKFILDYGKLYDIPTVATRFFNVYGPNQNPSSPYSGVLSLIARAAKNNERFTVFGDGEQTRDYIYVTDVINALKVVVTSQNSIHNVYNIATGTPISLNNIIKLFEKISRQKLLVNYSEKRLGDIKHSYANVSKLGLLGYTPEYTVLTGLKKYWESLT